jgi:hypothetical protein
LVQLLLLRFTSSSDCCDVSKWLVTVYNEGATIDKIKHLAANKTVAWIDYMTNYNRTFGDFAAGEALDFMVLNRRYEVSSNNTIEAQNRLANAQATKTIAEANKIAGVDTEGQELQNKWQEIENRIQTSRESIEQSNMKQAAANADKAVEDWKISVLEREYLDNVQEERVTLLVSEIAKIQKEGSLAESATDVNYHTARKIEKEVENFYYEMITRRMSAEAAKESAENMLKKIENDYKLGSDQNLREWIYGGVDRINGILETIVKFKNGAQILEAIAKKIKK